MYVKKLIRVCSFLLVLSIFGNYVVLSSAEVNNSSFTEQLTSGDAQTSSGDANNVSGDAADSSTIDLTEYEYREVIEEGSLVTIRVGEIRNIENTDVTISSTLSEDYINTMSDCSLKTELLENGTKYIDKNSVRYRQCNLKIAQDDIINYFKKFYYNGFFYFEFNRDIDFQLNRIEVLWWTKLDRGIPDTDVYPNLLSCSPHPDIYNVVEPNTNGWCSLIYTNDVISSQTGDYEYKVCVTYILYPKATTITPVPDVPPVYIPPDKPGYEIAGVKKGDTITYSYESYKVTNSNEKEMTVELTGTKRKVSYITIPNTIKIKGVPYKVTSIAKNAFKNNKTMKSVTIGSNITTIGANAFKGCSKLKTVKVKSKNIKSVGNNTFKGIHAKAQIKVPSSSLKKYKKLLSNKGQKSTVKIIK